MNLDYISAQEHQVSARGKMGLEIAPLLMYLESPLQIKVMRLLYGVGGEKPLNRAEVAKKLGCSRQNVGQAERRALLLLSRYTKKGTKKGRTGSGDK